MVEVTLPSIYYEGYTDHDLRIQAHENNYKSAIRNENGTVTLTMSQRRHNERLKELTVIIEDALDDLIGSSTTPYIKDISYNESYSEVMLKVDKNAYESLKIYYQIKLSS